MAKFKVGDVVEVIGQGLATRGKKGRVVKVDESRRGWPYTVSFSGSVSDGEYAESELDRAFNSRACNSKFEDGDYVRYNGGVWKILKVLGNGNIMLSGISGKSAQVSPKDITPAYNSSVYNSTDPVVANAMKYSARKACNAKEGYFTDHLYTLEGDVAKVFWCPGNMRQLVVEMRGGTVVKGDDYLKSKPGVRKTFEEFVRTGGQKYAWR